MKGYDGLWRSSWDKKVKKRRTKLVYLWQLPKKINAKSWLN